MKYILYSLIAFLFFLPLTESFAQQNADVEAQIDPIFAEWAGEDMPGGVVGVFEKGQLIFTNAMNPSYWYPEGKTNY